MTHGEHTTGPGWFGKIPALGDFASRRLPQAFVAAWDAWLQACVAASRAALGERWLDVYLRSPLWRFAALPGCCGEAAWLGVVMPSVDRVGRYFPLTIASRVDTATAALDVAASASEWYEALEAAALAMLDDRASPDELDARLARVPALPSEPSADPLAPVLAGFWRGEAADLLELELAGGGALGSALTTSTRAMVETAAHGKSLWWLAPDATDRTPLRGFAGLPEPAQFARLLAVR